MKSSKTLLLQNIDDYWLDEDDKIQPLKYLPSINKINILIGTNNSGKSKFMRKLMSFDKFFFLNDMLFNIYNEQIKNSNRYAQVSQRGKMLIKNLDLDTQINHLYGKNGDFHNFDVNKLITEKSTLFYYIPTLRTAHSLYQQTKEIKNTLGDIIDYEYNKIEDDILAHTLIKNYRFDEKINVFTGIHLYKDILNTRNSKRETRKRFESFEKFISSNFFDGKAIDIIAEFDKDASRKGDNTKEIISIHIEGENHSRDLFDLGDGIQALIILMYKIFMAENNSYVFIDEPEINLHPGMQRLFLEQIISNTDLAEKNLTYFISTHSNHFLDLSLEKNDISIYSFSSNLESDGNKKLIIKNVNDGDNDVLRNIGVNNSSVFMANCSIWVEGISDRIYIKAFLKSYCDYFQKKFPREDIDFAFFEYAGTNLDHYLFDDVEEEEQDEIINNIKALALSNKIFLVADSDNATVISKKGRRFEKIEKIESNNFVSKIIRTHREIENFLPNSVWEELLIELCNKKIISKNRKGVEDKIKQALGNIKSSNYHKKYIGEFLNDIRNKMGKSSNSFILNQSEYEVKKNNKYGSLKNKRSLSEIFASKEFSWEKLRESKAIEKLTIDMCDFITNKK
ncbi:ATP-binding protein [Epilithonimonas sp. JDS]|uniref:AAA family ATPase n=1 Tax=Epilithonimonas sp. JDS TaxID=2902797 RepID=UPI001E497E83|nr:AAA family ATPase [Epilithonimonas sp. JDS]MCD9855726.1 ATP-binding protein [Epilithonimonas sp. JDS]